MISTSLRLATSPGSSLPLWSLLTQIQEKAFSRLTVTKEIGMIIFILVVILSINILHRNNLTAWLGGDDLVLAVATQNPNTIVIVHSVGPLIVEPWIDHPNVTAVGHFRIWYLYSTLTEIFQVVWAGLPGQEAGNSLTDVLYGDYNPSGRLPYTIAKLPSDYPTHPITGGAPQDILVIPYTEG
jgi:beta-glucosidase